MRTNQVDLIIFSADTQAAMLLLFTEVFVLIKLPALKKHIISSKNPELLKALAGTVIIKI